MIEIDDITVGFGGVIALRNVSVRLDAPVVGIIGPNGAGKTTFLNVFSGFVTPSSGQITAFGERLLRLRPHQRARWGLRRSFQKEQVVDELTVEDNVRVILDPLGLPAVERERHLAAALEFTGIASARKTRASELNALERRMTELARCAAGQPRIVMLDEPGAGFSQIEVARLQSVITGMRAFNGAMVLLIDHDVELIQATCPVDHGPEFRLADRGRPDRRSPDRRQGPGGLSRRGAGRVSKLIIRDLVVRRGAKTVVDHLSLALETGRITSLIGPNGAGKSSLVLALAGVLPIESGSVELDGLPLAGKAPDFIRAAGVAAVPEGHRVLPGLSVEDNLQAAGFQHSLKHMRSVLAEIYAIFPELEERKGQKGRNHVRRPAADARPRPGAGGAAEIHPGGRNVAGPRAAHRQAADVGGRAAGQPGDGSPADRTIHRRGAATGQ